MASSSSISLSGDCVLVHGNAFAGHYFHRNATTAYSFTSIGVCIEATLSCPERPLLPTILFVKCLRLQEEDFTNEPPRIIRVVEDTILFSVVIGPQPHDSPPKCDYFIYRVDRDLPTLQLLPPPLDNFIDEDAGILRHRHGDDEEFIVAALMCTDKFGIYELHRFDSRTGAWSQVVVPLVEPQVSFPFRMTGNSIRLGYHLTSTVINIDASRMGWVDLWRGILICDVLDSKPQARGVPLPLPMDLLTRDHEVEGFGRPYRGIAVVNQCLRFVHLETTVSTTYKVVPTDSDDSDEEDPVSVMCDWVIHTWTNAKMTSSWKDWIVGNKARASHTTIPTKVKSKMLKSGLLSPQGAEPVRALQNLIVSYPAPAIHGDDGVVYLLARLRPQDLKAFMIALDTNNNVLLGSAEFATEKKPGAGIMYYPSNIAKYIDPKARVLPIPKGDEDSSEESCLHEGTENVEFLDSMVMMHFHGLKFDDPSSVSS